MNVFNGNQQLGKKLKNMLERKGGRKGVKKQDKTSVIASAFKKHHQSDIYPKNTPPVGDLSKSAISLSAVWFS